MMDFYSNMGDEYIERANIINRRMKAIRQDIKEGERKKATEIDELRKRLNILDDMYYDCLFTGRLLKKRGMKS